MLRRLVAVMCYFAKFMGCGNGDPTVDLFKPDAADSATAVVDSGTNETGPQHGQVGGAADPMHAYCRSGPKCSLLGKCAWESEPGCVATAAGCAASELCRVVGYRGATGTGCRAVPDATGDCAGTFACKVTGSCHFERGKCVVAAAADCQASSNCRQLGQCGVAAIADGLTCAPTGDADCARSLDCAIHGRCTAKEFSCTAASPIDCQRSLGCLLSGNCH